MSRDLLGAAALALGVGALLTTLATAMVGIGMMLMPVREGDPKAGAACMLIATIVCGVPGAIATWIGTRRLVRED